MGLDEMCSYKHTHNSAVHTYISAINMYAVSRARADFETNFGYRDYSTEIAQPKGLGIKVKGLRPYDKSWKSLLGSNELESSVFTMVDNDIVEAQISYTISDIEGQNTISKVVDEGLTRGYFSENRYRFSFQSSTNRDIGAIEFANTKKGKVGYENFKRVADIIYKAAYYSEAIKYDKENNIDYNSKHSTQQYLDKLDSDYKDAYNTKVNIKMKDNVVAVKIGKGKNKEKFKIEIKKD